MVFGPALVLINIYSDFSWLKRIVIFMLYALIPKSEVYLLLFSLFAVFYHFKQK